MAEEKIKLLFVDDEVNNLLSFKATFRREFEVFTAETAELGEKMLEENEIPIIIADYRMPDVTGVEFFERIIPNNPDSIRILLTGYADIEAVIDAINKGEVYRFVRKPWDENELRNTIKNGYEIYRTKRELKEKNIALVESYNELDRFVYSAAHDLTAPLTSIMGILKVADVEKENSELYFGMIEKSVYKLHEFVSNIIDYHRNKKLDQELITIDFKKLINETLENFEFYQEKSTISFNIQVDAEHPFESDLSRLKIVFNNLISNAIKYQKPKSDDGLVEVKVKTHPDKAEIEIRDNGIGISKDHITEIFKMYFRASNEKAGTGIGLYIVNEVIQKLQGEIKVESEKNIGTKFAISLPKIAK